MKMTKKNIGRFGGQVKQYESGRRDYGPEIIEYLKSLLHSKNPLILDLGCGTGISTRQLISIGKIIGCDPDLIMLKAAKRHKTNQLIKYIVSYADKLPFKDSTFDAVTAFAAFHWFNDKKSVSEIKRVLKPGGLLFLANKTGTASWGNGYRQAIIKSTGVKVIGFRYNTNYDPINNLKRNGFLKIKTKTWKKSEIYTLANALEYVQSISIWNSVPKNKRKLAIKGLREYFEGLLKNKGRIERKLILKAVAGYKKA